MPQDQLEALGRKALSDRPVLTVAQERMELMAWMENRERRVQQARQAHKERLATRDQQVRLARQESKDRLASTE